MMNKQSLKPPKRYMTIHKRLQRANVRTGHCSDCWEEGFTHMALIHKKGIFTDPVNGMKFGINIGDYIELCPKCHIRYDTKKEGQIWSQYLS